MLDLSTCIKYYMREDIQKALLVNADHRELGTRYLAGHFGKRPDMLQNEADILELAKQGVSSFHISEEHWVNPLSLSPSLNKKELEKMRQGWDLVIDIDCPDWELSKKIAFVIVKILKKQGISSISCKFSGNKGFHIGVPFKSFPSFVQGEPVKKLFPTKVKRIMEYLVFCAKDYSDEILQGMNIKELAPKLGVDEKELLMEICSSCGAPRKSLTVKHFFLCSKCGCKTELDSPKSHISCPKCKSIVRPSSDESKDKCKNCNSTAPISKKINLHLVLGLDQILISPRHLYRMPYSLHEKSGLASIPINPFTVLAFDKKQAKPETVKVNFTFLDDTDCVEGEAEDFILNALDYKPDIIKEDFSSRGFGAGEKGARTSYDVDDIQEKIPMELFPPSILNILKGLKDGRKRALFVLVNFLTSVGWNYDDITELLEEWNKKNLEPLRERELKSQVAYHKIQKKRVLPPNYSNNMYYADLGVLTPEEANGRLKNPVTYAKKRAYFLNQQDKRKGKKNSSDDKKESNTKKQSSPDSSPSKS